MSNSSAQPTYSTISTSDTITIDSYDTIDISSLSSNSITYISSPSYSYSPSISSTSGLSVGGTITLPSLTTAQINSITINPSTFTFKMPDVWVDQFPDFDRVQKMCKQYPALEIALRNFKTVYQLVKDDYDNPTPKK